MDGKGSDVARDVAKALRREGIYQAYIMKGGFAAWEKQGLPTVEGADYEINVGVIIQAREEGLVIPGIEHFAFSASEL